MPISFTCTCGKQLQAKDDQAGKRSQCPACGRAILIPAPPAEQKGLAGWVTDDSPTAAARAERAGVVRQGRASVMLLHSARILDRPLSVSCKVTCWNCHSQRRFTGTVFGRPGLGGTLAAAACPKCHASTSLSFSSHLAGKETDVYIYAPSQARDFELAEGESFPVPTFQIDKVAEVPPLLPTRKGERLNDLVPEVGLAVLQRQPYDKLGSLAARVVTFHLSPGQAEDVCRSFTGLLEKDQPTYVSAILAEALACLRKDSADQAVQAALQRALAREDPADPSNLPLQDLCILAVLFGETEGFQQALNRGMKDLAVSTRACKLGLRLSPAEVAELLEHGDVIDSYESTLGGTSWQRIQPLVLPATARPPEEGPKQWLKRLFGKKEKKE